MPIISTLKAILLKKPSIKNYKFMLNLVLFLVLIYLSSCIFYHFSYKNKYQDTNQNPLPKIGTFLLQPFMEVFGNSKVTHFWHYKDTSSSSLDPKKALFLESQTPQSRNFEKGLSALITNAIVDLSSDQEGAIIQPVAYDGSWRLVSCSKDLSICQRSTILSFGKVKILLDGGFYLWGENSEKQIIELKLEKKIKITEAKEFLYL